MGRVFRSYSPRVCKEWDMTEGLTHTHTWELHMVELAAGGWPVPGLGLSISQIQRRLQEELDRELGLDSCAGVMETVLASLCSTPPCGRCSLHGPVQSLALPPHHAA